MKASTYFRLSWISLALFLMLTISVLGNGGVTRWIDSQMMSGLARLVNPNLTHLFIMLTHLGSPLVVSLIVIILLVLTFGYSLKSRLAGAAYFFGSSALGLLLKHIFLRSRPEHQLLADTGYSYPSGHTLCIALFFGLLVFLTQRLDQKWLRWFILIIFGVFTLGVILSRVYLRDHYPTDILASLFLSASAYGLF